MLKSRELLRRIRASNERSELLSELREKGVEKELEELNYILETCSIVLFGFRKILKRS